MKIYLVGGAVRDALLDIPVKDRDWVVVGATPEKMLKEGYQRVGADFPVFLHPESKEEYALARTERKSGRGYHGFEVSFDSTVTLEQDLLRRDLTINAMAQDENGDIIDPFNGQADLKTKTLRHVSDTFREDPLRVLRVARFAARFYHLGFTLAPETEKLLQEMSGTDELSFLVAERVWTETSRALTESKPSEYFRVLKTVGALKTIFPELDRLFGVPQTMRWHPEIDTGIHTLKALDAVRKQSDEVTVLMATLCHDLGKGLTPDKTLPSHHGHESTGADLIKRLGNRYKWPNAVINLAEKVARYHTHCHGIKSLKPSTLLTLLKNLDGFRNPELVEQFGVCCAADYTGRSGFELREYKQRQWLLEALDAATKITAAPFIEQGIKGKAIGEAIDQARVKELKRVQAQW